MPITEQEIEKIKRIILDGAKAHFPPTVSNSKTPSESPVMLETADEEEYIDVRTPLHRPQSGARRSPHEHAIQSYR